MKMAYLILFLFILPACKKQPVVTGQYNGKYQSHTETSYYDSSNNLVQRQFDTSYFCTAYVSQYSQDTLEVVMNNSKSLVFYNHTEEQLYFGNPHEGGYFRFSPSDKSMAYYHSRYGGYGAQYYSSNESYTGTKE